MSDIKARDYANKTIDQMSAEELRDGALKWMMAEAQGEGLGDLQAGQLGGGKKGGGKKALLARIEQLEAQIKGGGR